MRIFVFIILMLVAFFVAAYVFVRTVWKALRYGVESLEMMVTGKPSANTHHRRGGRSKEQVIIDVTPEPVIQEQEYTDEDKASLAALAVSAAFANKSGESAHEALVRLSRLADDSKDKHVGYDLSQIRRIALELYSIFKKDTSMYQYTYSQYSQCLGGLNEIAGKDNCGDVIAGMLYASEYIRDYIKNLHRLVEISYDAEALKDEISGLLKRAERLYWLFLSYPAESSAKKGMIDAMISSVTDKLKIYIKVTHYGADSNEVSALLAKSRTTLQEMNVAMDTVLNNILSKDLLEADVELETLRQEMRLRGLY